jgi:hypothetical protein
MRKQKLNLCFNCVLGFVVLNEEGSISLPKGTVLFEYFMKI